MTRHGAIPRLAAVLLLALLGARADDPVARILDPIDRRTGFETHGFLELRAGTRLQHDPHEDDMTVADLPRLQIETSRAADWGTVTLRADFLYDDVRGNSRLDLERGRGWLDLREANVLFSPFDFMDVKIGRQILTWGTGSYLFINDLFPKDWQSFFAGRDAEYLKAPSDAILVSIFHDLANLDIAITPRFDPDRFITGERFSYYNSNLGRSAGHDAISDPIIPDDWGDDAEIALRLSGLAGAWEWALYAYHGFWKSPGGYDPVAERPTFPDLAVYGASIRGSALGGILNAEIGYYDSLDDRDGDDPDVANSQLRGLLGYSRELAQDLTLGLQYYVELQMHHADYRDHLPAGQPAADEYRHVVTISLTQLALDQNLILHSFLYLSPSDQDLYWRPSATWKINDYWQAGVGANVFLGDDDHTFFGQFDRNTNAYITLRRSF